MPETSAQNLILNWRVTVTLTVMIQSCCCMPPFVTLLRSVLGDTKIPFRIKKEAQAVSNSLEGESNGPEFHAVPDLTVHTSAVSVFDQVPLATMAKAQAKDSVLGLVIPFIHKGVKPKGLVISKIRCKAAHKYLLQFDSIIIKKGCPTLDLHHQ